MRAITVSPLINNTVSLRFSNDDEPAAGVIVQTDNNEFYKVGEVLERNVSAKKGYFTAKCLVEKLN